MHNKPQEHDTIVLLLFSFGSLRSPCEYALRGLVVAVFFSSPARVWFVCAPVASSVARSLRAARRLWRFGVVVAGSFALVRSSLVLRQSAVSCPCSAGGSPLRECRTHSAIAAALVPLAVVRLLRFRISWHSGWLVARRAGIEPARLVQCISGVAPMVIGLALHRMQSGRALWLRFARSRVSISGVAPMVIGLALHRTLYGASLRSRGLVIRR